jgi:hypothetical protein
MKSIDWAAALLLAVGLIGGCQPNKAATATDADSMPAPDRIAAAKAQLSSQGMIVGTVDAVSDSAAHVTGIDPKSVTPADVLSFIDVQSNRVVANGHLRTTTDIGALVVQTDSQAERAPRVGDLCVKVK